LNRQLHPLLNFLVNRTYFKYFKVDYQRECPFWVENYLCQLPPNQGGCGVCECDENEIPAVWREEEKKSQRKLDHVDQTLEGTFSSWDDDDFDIWSRQSDNMVYLNLQRNPERYTGYGGFNSTRIWNAIYHENCFPGTVDTQCFEERVFYRLISGLHGSTTTHICKYFTPKNQRDVEKSGNLAIADWHPNLNMFIHRLALFPERIKNIYFTFLFLLRAVSKASNELLQQDYRTGNSQDDQLTVQTLHNILSVGESCSSDTTFDELLLFKGANKSLIREFRNKFLNISDIMDCVSCETCKVHSKLQLLGITTAFKILLNNGNGNESGHRFNMKRNEIIALFNTLQKFSDSIDAILVMREQVLQLKETEWNENENANNNNNNKESGVWLITITASLFVVFVTLCLSLCVWSMIRKKFKSQPPPAQRLTITKPKKDQ